MIEGREEGHSKTEGRTDVRADARTRMGTGRNTIGLQREKITF